MKIFFPEFFIAAILNRLWEYIKLKIYFCCFWKHDFAVFYVLHTRFYCLFYFGMEVLLVDRRIDWTVIDVFLIDLLRLEEMPLDVCQEGLYMLYLRCDDCFNWRVNVFVIVFQFFGWRFWHLQSTPCDFEEQKWKLGI